ncbi:MAG: ATP-binding protein [Spirochaeta sp.]|nr:ATP-binding protein [Spirochaeta sp.]
MVPRTLAASVHRLLEKYPVLFVTGPRQSGKTTLLKALLPDYRYVNLEFPDERERVREDIRSFLSEHRETGVIIDEAQRLPELFSYLQGFVDDTGEMGRFVLSGSQNYLLMEGVSQSLSGRVGLLNLLPFTTEELADTVYRYDDPLDYVYRGMYPATYDRDISPTDLYPGYVRTYIERDVRTLKNIGDLDRFHRFLQLCAGRVGQVVNFSSLANDLGIDHKTVKAWLSVLQAGYIVFLLGPHHRNFNKRVIKQSKLYFYDSGLAAFLTGIRRRQELDTFHLRGALFENFIVSEYVKGMHHRGMEPDAWFFRDSTGNEVDLIIERADDVRAVEIKAGSTVSRDSFRSLERYRTWSDLPPEQAYLLYSGDESMQRKVARLLSWKDLPVLLDTDRTSRK